jgi:hypothetical protein
VSLYYAVIKEGGEDTAWWSVVGLKPWALGVGCCGKAFEGGAEVAFRGSGGGLEGTFWEAIGIEGGLYGGRRGCGEDFGL